MLGFLKAEDIGFFFLFRTVTQDAEENLKECLHQKRSGNI